MRCSITFCYVMSCDMIYFGTVLYYVMFLDAVRVCKICNLHDTVISLIVTIIYNPFHLLFPLSYLTLHYHAQLFFSSSLSLCHPSISTSSLSLSSLFRIKNGAETFKKFVIRLSFVYTKQPLRIAQVLKQVYPVDPKNVDDELVER